MLPVTGVVAHLGKERKAISVTHSHWITLPACGRQVRHCMLCCHKHPNLWHNKAEQHSVSIDHIVCLTFRWVGLVVTLPYKCPPGSSQTASTYGLRYKSPSSPPLCQHSSGSGSWCRQSSPIRIENKLNKAHLSEVDWRSVDTTSQTPTASI